MQISLLQRNRWIDYIMKSMGIYQPLYSHQETNALESIQVLIGHKIKDQKVSLKNEVRIVLQVTFHGLFNSGTFALSNKIRTNKIRVWTLVQYLSGGGSEIIVAKKFIHVHFNTGDP